MKDNMARSRADDIRDPNNFPEWDGQWDCPECDDRCANVVQADEPIKDCYDHTEDGDVRAHARKEIKDIHLRHYDRVVGLNNKIAELEKDNVYYKKGWETKDARIHEIEAALAKSHEHFDRMNQLVQAYEKLLKG